MRPFHPAQKVVDRVCAASQTANQELASAFDSPADGLILSEAFAIGHDIRTAMLALHSLERKLQKRIDDANNFADQAIAVAYPAK